MYEPKGVGSQSAMTDTPFLDSLVAQANAYLAEHFEAPLPGVEMPADAVLDEGYGVVFRLLLGEAGGSDARRFLVDGAAAEIEALPKRGFKPRSEWEARGREQSAFIERARTANDPAWHAVCHHLILAVGDAVLDLLASLDDPDGGLNAD